MIERELAVQVFVARRANESSDPNESIHDRFTCPGERTKRVARVRESGQAVDTCTSVDIHTLLPSFLATYSS